MKRSSLKIILSLLCLSVYLFLATGSDESSSTNSGSSYTPSEEFYEDEVVEESVEEPVEIDPIIDNDDTVGEDEVTEIEEDYFENTASGSEEEN